MIVSNNTIRFAIWRYSLFFLFVYFWPQIVKCIGEKQKWHPRLIIKLLRIRWRLVIFFVCFEILIIYNGLNWFVIKIIGLF